MGIKYCIRNADGRLVTVDDPGNFPVISSYSDDGTADVRAKADWSFFDTARRRYQKWLALLNPNYAGVLDYFKARPADFSHDAWLAEAWEVFDAVVKSDPRTNAEKWAAMGSPKYLQYYFGFSKREPTDRELAIWAQWDDTGYKPPEEDPDPRKKGVVEPATGLRWTSAADAAREIGCHQVTLYSHLSGKLKTVHGRVFEYTQKEDGPLPGSYDAMTPDERADLYQKTLEAGFKPRFEL